MKKRKIKKFKIVVTILFIILLFLLGWCLKDIIGVLKNNGASEVEILEKIEDYNYTLNENDSEYFKKVFNELKDELKKEKIDEENYAKLISELFVVDFFSLDKSLSKNDVGGVQFIYTDYQESFIKLAKEGIYKYVESNIYGDRKQELPNVTSVEITDIKQDSITFSNDVKDTKAYYVSLTITYEENLEYQENVELVLIHSNNKLEIAKMD